MNGVQLMGLFLVINLGFTVADVSLHRRRNAHQRARTASHLRLCEQLRGAIAELAALDPGRAMPLEKRLTELDRVERELRGLLDRPRWRRALDY